MLLGLNLSILNLLKGKGPIWNKYLGDCTVIGSFLKDKPLSSPLWSVPHIVNICLRCVGQVDRQIQSSLIIISNVLDSLCEQPFLEYYHFGGHFHF